MLGVPSERGLVSHHTDGFVDGQEKHDSDSVRAMKNHVWLHLTIMSCLKRIPQKRRISNHCLHCPRGVYNLADFAQCLSQHQTHHARIHTLTHPQLFTSFLSFPHNVSHQCPVFHTFPMTRRSPRSCRCRCRCNGGPEKITELQRTRCINLTCNKWHGRYVCLCTKTLRDCDPEAVKKAREWKEAGRKGRKAAKKGVEKGLKESVEDCAEGLMVTGEKKGENEVVAEEVTEVKTPRRSPRGGKAV